MVAVRTPSLLPNAAAPLPAPVAESETDVESMIAGRWLYYVGILALAFAVTFFLKYAFDNDWIGPTGRVGMGLLAGSALYPFSHWLLQRGYRYFSEGIAGLGAAILYSSMWAGWYYYMRFPQSVAFALMIVVTAVTVVVALGRDSERIAVLGLIGGVLTPSLVSTGQNAEVTLFSYITILGVGVLAVAWKRRWMWLPPILFASTVVYFWGWYSDFYSPEQMNTTLCFATVFLLLFGVLPAIRGSREGQLPRTEVSIVVGNAFNYLIALRAMLWPEHRWGLTLAVLVLSAAHLLAERALPPKKTEANQIARFLYAGLALVFATLAIPIRLDGHWITIAWAVEGALLLWGGLRIGWAALRYAGMVLFLIVAVRIIALPIEAAPDFLLNAGFLTLAFCSAAAFAVYWFSRKVVAQLEQFERTMLDGLAIAANLCLLVALSREVRELYGRKPALGIDVGLAQQLALSILWITYALALLFAGMRWKSPMLRWQGLALLGVTVIKVFFVDLSFLARFYRIMSFLVLGIVLLMVSFYYQRLLGSKSKEKK
jgi:uncharacterized membrane protein